MALIGEKDRTQIKDTFTARLKGPVTLSLFMHDTDSPEYEECQYCDETKELVSEIAGLSEHIEVVEYDFAEDVDEREDHGVVRAPAISISADGLGQGIRYYGIPSGYEAQSFIEDIIDVSTGDTGLAKDTMEWLSKLDKPVHLQVFVTPT